VFLTGLTGLSGWYEKKLPEIEWLTAQRNFVVAEGDGVFPLSSGERER
jgi:hypothetical protein